MSVPKTLIMQKLNFTILALMMFTLSSCEVIGDIFKAGVWTGLLLVAAVIALVIWIISRFMK
jgi:hypothetical protein